MNVERRWQGGGQIAYEERRREIAQLERECAEMEDRAKWAELKRQAPQKNLDFLLSGLRDGTLDPDALDDPRAMEGQALSGTGWTVAEVLRAAGKLPSRQAPASGQETRVVKEYRIMRMGHFAAIGPDDRR